MKKNLFIPFCAFFIYFVTNSSFLCNKDSTQLANVSYLFEYTLGGQKYNWSGGLPSLNNQGVACAYTPSMPQIAGDKPGIIFGGDVRISPFNIAISIPISGTGTFTCNNSTTVSQKASFGLVSASLTNPETYIGDPVTVTINSISQQQFGVVSGSFSGTVINPVTQVKKSINGSFKAWRAG
jgi:hypothetical protein